MMRKEKRQFGIRNTITVAAMMILYFIFSLIVGMVTLPIPLLYLYGSPAIDAFIGAIFYLVAANRIGKHGLLFTWSTVYGLITGLMGYAFMIPYFLMVAVLAELTMIGKDSYRKPLRNMIGWGTYSIGMVVGIAVPIWFAWESYKKMASEGGFSSDTLMMQYDMVTKPELLFTGIIITAILSSLGILFGQKLLKRHFEKAGVVG